MNGVEHVEDPGAVVYLDRIGLEIRLIILVRIEAGSTPSGPSFRHLPLLNPLTFLGDVRVAERGMPGIKRLFNIRPHVCPAGFFPDEGTTTDERCGQAHVLNRAALREVPRGSP